MKYLLYSATTLALLCAIAGLAGLPAPAALAASAPILDKQKELSRFTFWDNRDWDWYKARIPFFESPDAEIDETYYYRWELTTKHLSYGSPQSGYNITEFINRVPWAGHYGSISCSMPQQIYELRWLKDRRITDDYARYWFSTPGAQPRTYSNWYGDALWANYLVNGDRKFQVSLLPSMEAQYQGWINEHWDAGHRMFHWAGVSDGMEGGIGARQTKYSFSGADSYRPTLNSYVYGDLMAMSRTAALAGENAKSAIYRQKAADLKARIVAELWDPKRQFFMSQFAFNEVGPDGSTIKAGTLMYQDGKYAGDPHGRELTGYIPWYFHLPSPGKGYEAAWNGVSDPDVFLAPYGLYSVERHDPLFFDGQSGCWWSGNNWPFDDSIVLTAMANVIDDYAQNVIGPDDYFKVLKSYTRSERKEGIPFLAEDQDPITGRWVQDGFNSSESYFHSSYNDLIITGLAGLRPRADDIIEVNPLVPRAWSYFALDDVAYHGRRVSIVWDRDGTRYHRGAGLSVWADGRRIASSRRITRLEARLPSPTTVAQATIGRPINFAVNTDNSAFPQVRSTYCAPDKTPYPSLNGTSMPLIEQPSQRLIDGLYFYPHDRPVDRWTTEGSPNPTDSVELRFGVARPLETVKLYFLDDAGKTTVRAPAAFALEYWNGTAWRSIPGQRRAPGPIIGHRATTVTFPRMEMERLRAVLTPQPGASVGMTEFEAWGHASLPLPAPPASASDLAIGATATASYTSEYNKVGEINDGKIEANGGGNRWTAYQSPNSSDWVQLDFGKTVTIGRMGLYLWADGFGIDVPQSLTYQYWNGNAWADVTELSRDPAAPTAGVLNEIVIQPIHTDKLRATFTHHLPRFSGATEWMVWER